MFCFVHDLCDISMGTGALVWNVGPSDPFMLRLDDAGIHLVYRKADLEIRSVERLSELPCGLRSAVEDVTSWGARGFS